MKRLLDLGFGQGGLHPLCPSRSCGVSSSNPVQWVLPRRVDAAGKALGAGVYLSDHLISKSASPHSQRLLPERAQRFDGPTRGRSLVTTALARLPR